MPKRKRLFHVLQQLVDSKREKLTTTQDTLDYVTMKPNGVCKVDSVTYNKMIRFSDVSYQLSQDETKQKIFAQYSALLNSFDNTVNIQFAFINYRIANEDDQEEVIEYNKDLVDFEELRTEYFNFLESQKEKGNNGIVRNKYIIFSVTDKSYKSALRRLESLEATIKRNLKVIGSVTESITGIERLSIVNYLLNGGEKHCLDLENTSKEILALGTTKDLIAPKDIDFESDPKKFRVNQKYGATLNFRIEATELSDRVLSDFLEEDLEMLVSMHIRTLEQPKAVKMVKTKNSDLQALKIEEQKKALRAGYDMDILPTDLNANVEESNRILKDLQRENEKYFFLTFTITVFGKDSQELEDNIFKLKSVATKQNCTLTEMSMQQEKALLSALPLSKNLNEPELERGLTTSSTAIFIPFTTQELYQEGNDAVYYGLNALSNNMIQISRKRLKNPNGLLLGTPGSGKTFSAKREIIDTFLRTTDDIIISDPEGEYFSFIKLLGGEEIKIAYSSKDYINPMDISENYGEGENPVSFKSDFILDMMALIAGGKDGLTPKEKSLTDKCVRKIYRPFMEDPKRENIPILEDLYKSYLESDTEEGEDLAAALELYVHGSLNIFNNRTTINTNNRLINFNIKELGSNLKDLGMLVVQDHVWNKVTTNRTKGTVTWFYMDEFHKLLADERTASYSVEFWKRFRKWGGIPTGITQNVKDLLSSPKISTILENSDFIYLLNQSKGDRQILQQHVGFSDYQGNYITNSSEGEGLLSYSGIVIPFKDKFPKNNKLYPVMTSKPEEIKKFRKEGYNV